MNTYLTESNFLTVDISSVWKKQKPNTEINNTNEQTTHNEKMDNVAKPTNAKIDWAKELEQRLDDNAKLDAAARQTDFEIENQFWLEFFTAGWGEELAFLLNNIEQLKKDIKVLGFKKQTNPLIAFLKIKYVQTELIKTKLINSNTYEAIHKAIAKHYIADSEFFKANDYNILYCRDLYAKPVADIEKYLDAQKIILPTNISIYDVTRQNRNKRVFLQLGQKSTKQKAAKLNTLSEIYELLEIKDTREKPKNTTSTEINNENNTETDRTDLNAFVSAELNSPAEIQAVLQYISMFTQNEIAANALRKLSERGFFKNVSNEALIKATRAKAAVMNKVTINKNNAADLVSLIVQQAQIIK